MTRSEDRVELKPGVVLLCKASRHGGGEHVYMLLERLSSLRRFDVPQWRCLLLDSDHSDMKSGAFYYPDESYLRRGREVS